MGVCFLCFLCFLPKTELYRDYAAKTVGASRAKIAWKDQVEALITPLSLPQQMRLMFGLLHPPIVTQ